MPTSNVSGRKKPKLSEKAKRLTTAALIRFPEAFRAVSGTFDETKLPDLDRPYAAVLGIARTYYEKHRKLPPKAHYLIELEDAVGVEAWGEELDDAKKVVAAAFSPKTFPVGDEQTYVHFVAERCRSWIAESVSWRLSGVLSDPDGTPENLSSVLQDAQRTVDATPGVDSHLVPFSAGWHKKPGLKLRETGVKVFDRFMRGGDAKSEVIGVMGPYGSWKTLNAVQMVGEAVKQAAAYVNPKGEKAEPWDGRWPFAVLVSYEAPLDADEGFGELRIRLLSYLAQVEKGVLEDCKDIEDEKYLSRTDGKYKEYEKKLFAKEFALGMRVPGEYERVAEATRLCNNHLYVVDLSAGGRGWVPEVEQRLASFLVSRRHMNPFFNFFYLDYVLLMCKRHVESIGGDRYAVTDYINRTPDAVKQSIGRRFNVPCWLNNQLSGDANARGPTAKISHADAGQCKSWAENLDFSFIIYKPDNGNIGKLDCDKHRRAPPCSESIVRVDGGFSRVFDASETHEIVGGQFIEKEVVATVSAHRPRHGRKESNAL
jgi:hypothetical protein